MVEWVALQLQQLQLEFAWDVSVDNARHISCTMSAVKYSAPSLN